MNEQKKLSVINLGLQRFYDALLAQGVQAAQLQWRPPRTDAANGCPALSDALRDKIDEANRTAVSRIIDGDPVWVDILPAGEVIDGLGDYTILHSGPPIAFEDMTMLHQRGMVSGCLFEGWAKTQEEALALIRSGKIRIESALDHNTVGAGTGIITKSVAMIVIEDRATGIRAATFPAEGEFQGGFCGWGLYSEGIAENLRRMREEWLPVMRAAVRKMGGMPLKPILAESMQMGDENHTRQTAADLLFDKKLLPVIFSLDEDKARLEAAIRYIVEKYRGNLVIDWKESMFTLSILLPLPEEKAQKKELSAPLPLPKQ